MCRFKGFCHCVVTMSRKCPILTFLYFLLGHSSQWALCVKNVCLSLAKSTGSSLTLAKMLRAEKRKQQAKMHQKNLSLNRKIFEQLWKVVENTKVVHYFDKSKGNFVFEAKISTVWLQIKFKIY